MTKVKIELKIIEGFTLVELLVVMALLAILATAVFMAINPIEQINKATDTQLNSSSLEFRNSLLRYLTTHSAYPWDETAKGGSDCLSGVNNPSGILVADVDNCTNILIQAGEMSYSIQNNINLRQGLFVTEDTSVSPIKLLVCYKPKARINIEDSRTKYTYIGEPTCTVGSGNCFSCQY